MSHIVIPDGLHNTLLSQGWVLENSSSCGIGGRNIHTKDRAWDEECHIAWVQDIGQVEVMSS